MKTIYLVHKIFPYGDGNHTVGYVNSMSEFDNYVKKVYSVNEDTKKELDYYGVGSKSYHIPNNSSEEKEIAFEVVCEPLKQLSVNNNSVIFIKYAGFDVLALSKDILKSYPTKNIALEEKKLLEKSGYKLSLFKLGNFFYLKKD